jgi:hypothetical protein
MPAAGLAAGTALPEILPGKAELKTIERSYVKEPV